MIYVPDVYLGATVPADIRELWWRWEGVRWREMAYSATNKLFPPDQRFGVVPADGMCALHIRFWRDYRDMMFNPVTGDRWPGTPGSPFLYVGHNMERLREERRREWDEKASAQMRQIETICLSGRSPQCAGDRTSPRAGS
ncbi:hypothetical protein [Streptacidiphilus sp. EB103A]|uniref:hypothetical protein n=1 Tax=Streptacidiphilus sp. EB103A TaxID=3156275 RepID=UPI003518F697